MKTLIAIASVAMLGFTTSSLAAGDAAAGKTKAKGCAECHGDRGEGKAPAPPDNEKTPKIAAMPAADFVKALSEYKSGKRDHAVMKMQSKKLSDADMANLAAYYGSLK
jgi:cytochrome c553